MGWISPHMARYLVCYYLGFRLLSVCVRVCVCVCVCVIAHLVNE